MRFTLLDRVTELEPGRRVAAVKCLTMGEEYLAEHFPGFPVLPGVLMVEAVAQAGAWLVRWTEGFRHSLVLLREVKTVKFGHFVTPGKQLHLECEWASEDGPLVTLKAKGFVDGNSSVQARVVLERMNLADRHPREADRDERIRADLKRQFVKLAPPELREKLEAA